MSHGSEHQRRELGASTPPGHSRGVPSTAPRSSPRLAIALGVLGVVVGAAAFRYYQGSHRDAVDPEVERRAAEMRQQIRDYAPASSNVEDATPSPAKPAEKGAKRSEPIKGGR